MRKSWENEIAITLRTRFFEALFLMSRSYSNNLKPNESKTKHKGVQDHYTKVLED